MTTTHDEDEEVARMVLGVLREIRRYQLGGDAPKAPRPPTPVEHVTAIRERILADPIGFRVGFTPATAHKDHMFDGDCAVCRASARTDALGVLIAAVLRETEAA